ncbi:Shedu immune nuclease family protein [Paenibacillus sp. IHBB 3054]|uniref:Shedu immune nuclease family protein n=1 Tax=Paenibacillus sp. IHBB 3054 TaxID=3425689 RepID=UPI003F6668FA
MKYKLKDNIIEAYIGNSTISGELLQVLHKGYVFDNCPFHEHTGYKYDQIKDLELMTIPNEFHFQIMNCYQGKIEHPMELIPYPFISVIFSKTSNNFSILFQLTDYDNEEDWRNEIKWVYEYYLEELKKQVEQISNLGFITLPHVHGENAYVTVIDKTAITIHNAFNRALPMINELIFNTNMSLQGINKFIQAIKYWGNNKVNSRESDWHEFFVQNSWILSQCFAAPFLVFNDKAYVGGKNISNKNGSILDFIYKNNLIDNIALLEIKTPTAHLIGREYRNDICSVSSELTGSINQILNYKDKLQKEYFVNRYNSNINFSVLNPKCILIIGNLEKLNEIERRSFELFRADLKSIEIITYDELFEKINLLKDLIT